LVYGFFDVFAKNTENIEKAIDQAKKWGLA